MDLKNSGLAQLHPRLSSFQCNNTVFPSFGTPEQEQKLWYFHSSSTDAGAVVYVNGKELVRWNMPSGDIKPTTQGIPSDVVTHKYAQLLAALPTPQEDAYVIAVELHAGPKPSQVEHFYCTVMYLYSDFRLIDSDGSSECTDDNLTDPTWKCSNIFDDDYNTMWGQQTSKCYKLAGLGQYLPPMMVLFGKYWMIRNGLTGLLKNIFSLKCPIKLRTINTSLLAKIQTIG